MKKSLIADIVMAAFLMIFIAAVFLGAMDIVEAFSKSTLSIIILGFLGMGSSAIYFNAREEKK